MRLFLSPIGLLVAVAVGCASGGETSLAPGQDQRKPSTRGAVTDYPSLIKSLRAAGAGATATGDVEQPFLSIKGMMVKVHGEDVQVFQYPSAAEMEAQGTPISRDGMAVGTRKIFWVGAPHFFKQGRLLVLYVGDNDKVLKALEAALGRQFAGQ